MLKHNHIKTIIGAIFLLCATRLAANPIGCQCAQKVAANFFKSNCKTIVNPQLAMTLTQRTSENQEFTYAYVFNVENGYIIVCADDRFEPILGYSTESTFDATNVPLGLRDLLNSYADEMENAIEHNVSSNSYIKAMWDALISGTYAPNTRNTSEVSPLLGNNNWNQNNGYNYYCPADANGPAGHAYAGCVALAMGQIMHYWEYPTHGVGSHSYECNHSSSQAGNFPDYGTLTANFENTTYNYSMMPNYLDGSTPSNQILAVAKLLYHCGIAVDMYYGPEGSMAFHSDIANALEKYFAYDTCQTLYKYDHESDWEMLLKEDLDLGHPIIYCAYTDAGGHEFICDGYNSNNYFHFNWGWGGWQNGYFLISNMNPDSYNFTSSHGVVLNIRPKQSTPISGDGIESIGETSIQVYPNPAAESIHIHTDSELMQDIAVFDNAGRLIMSRDINDQQYQLNVSTLPCGLYHIRITTPNGAISKSFFRKAN